MALILAVIISLVSSITFPVHAGGVQINYLSIVYHAGIFFLLGFFLFLSFDLRKRNMAVVFIFCFIYAVFDEIHQYFVPGRVMSVFDVCYNTLGILISIVFVLFFDKFMRKTFWKNL